MAESEGQQLVSDLLSTDVALGAWRVCAARAGSSGGAVLTVQRISELCLVCCCMVCYLGKSSVGNTFGPAQVGRSGLSAEN